MAGELAEVQIGTISAPGEAEEEVLKAKRAGTEGSSFVRTTVPDKGEKDSEEPKMVDLNKKEPKDPFPLRRPLDNRKRNPKPDLSGVRVDQNSGMADAVLGKGQNTIDTTRPGDFSANNAASVNKK